MRKVFVRLVRGLVCGLLLLPTPPVAGFAQNAAQQTGAANAYNPEQLDALLAPIALYPDTLLTQTLMACAYPLQIVQASRWLEVPANKTLAGDALTNALANQAWDPSVKSLVPFPDVLAMLNSKLDWTEQLGYAFVEQQADVLASVQRLRRQAQAAGSLQSNQQQVVTVQAQTVVIEPANPQVVYVPAYNPTVVYGTWPYPAYPPVYPPPPPYYPVGTALAAGLAFGAGVAIVGGLWNVGSPNWGRGSVNVNVNRYNSINVNRQQITSNAWRPPPTGGGAGRPRPPGGPVGMPARANGLPAGAIGRPAVQVPAGLVNRPTRPAGAPPAAAARPGAAPGAAAAARPGAPNIGANQRPANVPKAPTRAPGAFSDLGQGRQAGQFSNRGSQSRALRQPTAPAGGARAGNARNRTPRR